jgi:hypothetical protein
MNLVLDIALNRGDRPKDIPGARNRHSENDTYREALFEDR